MWVIQLIRAGANALNMPPGEYSRKAENSKELTGARTSGGACGLIRRNAKNLTWARNAMDQLVKAGLPARDYSIGAAWLSSARVVRCWVKSRNERNPCPVLPYRKVELAGDRQG